MAEQKLTILQHNVLNWTSKKFELYNIYRTVDLDIILLNSHGNSNNIPIKLFNYQTYQINPTTEKSDGAAIVVKKNIPHQIIDNFDEACLAMTVDITLGPKCLATGYQPPRRLALPVNNSLIIFSRQTPTYFIGDINARHKNFGHNSNNTAGNMLNDLINQGV